MLYLAVKLIMPSGEALGRMVVDVRGGEVVSVSPFEREIHSMSLLDEVFLSFSPASVVSESGEGVSPRYAFTMIDGQPVRLDG